MFLIRCIVLILETIQQSHEIHEDSTFYFIITLSNLIIMSSSVIRGEIGDLPELRNT